MESIKVINREEAKKLIEESKGKIFSVEFIKANGEHRKLTGRMEVTSHLHGGANSTAHKPDIVTVFDMELGQYRKFDLNRLEEIKTGGEVYKVS